MSDQTVIQIAGLIIGAAITGLFGLAIKGLWKLIAVTFENTTALTVVSAAIKGLTEDVKPIPKMKQDIDHLHRWRREVMGTRNNNEEEE